MPRRWGVLGRGAAAVVLILAVWSPVALAQEDPPAIEQAEVETAAEDTTDLSSFFPWAHLPGGFSENWPVGVARFLLGVAGAMVLVYLFLGEFLPSMGGKVEYETLKDELAKLKAARARSLDLREKYSRGDKQLSADQVASESALTDSLDAAVARLEQRITRERWRLFVLGFPMYLLLGGFFASAFAQNALQAVVVGFGWTAFADRIGLKREIDVREGQIQKSVLEFEHSAEEAQELRAKLRELDAQKAGVEELAKQLATALLRQPGVSGGQPPAPSG